MRRHFRAKFARRPQDGGVEVRRLVASSDVSSRVRRVWRLRDRPGNQGEPHPSRRIKNRSHVTPYTSANWLWERWKEREKEGAKERERGMQESVSEGATSERERTHTYITHRGTHTYRWTHHIHTRGQNTFWNERKTTCNSTITAKGVNCRRRFLIV